MKVIVVGGVAGGASAAARLRRLDESVEIVMFERGEFISFANCGLPYHVGNVISERSSLLVLTPEMLKDRTNIDVRTRQEVTAIDREKKVVSVRNLDSGASYEESYDKVILATGSTPVRPPLPGIDDPDVFQLWTIPDMDRIRGRVDQGATRAVVVGAGFIGLEVAENLRERGLTVDMVELMPQVLPTLDVEMSQPLAEELMHEGINLRLGRKVVSIHRHGDEAVPDKPGKVIHVELDNGDEIEADMVVLSIGVRANSELAGQAGLPLSERKGIVVDEHMCTEDPDIYAVGDAVSVTDLVTGEPAQIPLAGPANKQGRIAADNICGRDSAYKGTLGTAIVKVFGMTAGSAGHTERRLQAAGQSFQKIYLHPASHASYYPGASPLAIKLLFDETGKILGVQAVGRDGVDKRIDVIATAIRSGLSVYDLEELELAYAPPYGSAKDPVNFAGMIAANVLRGDSDIVHVDNVPENALLLDIREFAEVELGLLDGAVHIPLGQLRDRLGELPKDKLIVPYCKLGLRGYLAERILKGAGIQSANLCGGVLTWKQFFPDPVVATPAASTLETTPVLHASPTASTTDVTRRVDVTALQCPGPVVRVRHEIEEMAPGEVLQITATRAFRSDLEAWCGSTGNALLSLQEQEKTFEALVQKGVASQAASGGLPAVSSGQPESAAIVLFSGDLDKAMAAFIIATGMAALGTKVSIFFTFWGLNVLRKDRPPSVTKDILSRMFGFMMPCGARKLALSKMHMMGMGTGMMKYVMGKKNVATLPELIQQARELGITFIACDMAMDVMGMQREELLDSVDDVAGVAKFAALAKDSGTTLFI